MYERRLVGVVATTFAFLACVSCDATPSRPDSGPGVGMDAGAGMDAGTTSCTSNAECDDAIACTLDECVVGNVCQHTPLHAMCTPPEMCNPTLGCTEPTGDCTTDADCDDGLRCNGMETCITGRGMCIPGDAVDCDDGNECTIDSCSETGGMCQYDVAPGCDAGGLVTDAGPPCDPFDPTTDYSGNYSLLPGQACDAGLGGGYSVSALSFSVSADTLTVTAGPFTLTQSPVPTGPDFDVSGSNGCGNVRLMGSFECANRYRAMWTATHTGMCNTCPAASATVVGVRR